MGICREGGQRGSMVSGKSKPVFYILCLVRLLNVDSTLNRGRFNAEST